MQLDPISVSNNKHGGKFTAVRFTTGKIITELSQYLQKKPKVPNDGLQTKKSQGYFLLYRHRGANFDNFPTFINFDIFSNLNILLLSGKELLSLK